ncbi:homocysteine S-methyltransferase [Streptomyces sp. ISL-11]|uniref:homocysteine S-methyltransferase n=1 Tax=Streptomyces sp. ISL-11 TaxID=2819174 RepID=UPI001BE96729|nr:homocysteine S-methyltransferase [Streptomyces sp. ISL-11]MBT2383758.1 homocysteine S-methyltransferase [Streptomyces sp. ISL-11]
MPLADALARGPLVLDGGLSNQLAAQGCDLSDTLWSARLLADDPAQIEEAHAAYVRAGARVLITSSYQATFEGFARRGIGGQEAAGLLRRSVELTRRAGTPQRKRGAGEGGVGGGAPSPHPSPWVAASVGPYGAMLADGSEYRGRYGLSVAELERFHRPRVETLAEAGPDVLALETVPDIDEAEALLRAVRAVRTPVWLSYSVAGGRTRAGQPLREAFELAAGNDQVIAVGVNCCAPGDADHAVALAAEVTGKPVVVYPNSGERWDARARGWRGRPTFDPGRVAAWRDAGARLIGGCCRVGPDRIAALSRTLETGSHEPAPQTPRTP